MTKDQPRHREISISPRTADYFARRLLDAAKPSSLASWVQPAPPLTRMQQLRNRVGRYWSRVTRAWDVLRGRDEA